MSADTRGIVLEPPRSGRTVGAAAHVGRPARLRHRIGRGAQGIRRAAGAKIAMHTEQNEPTSRTTCWNCCSNGLVRAQGLLTARRYRARPLCEVRRYHARAERTGQSALLIERDRAKCDLIVRRWQEFTGGTARLAGGCETFAEAAERRAKR